ncbi:adenylyl-sulfate kinase [Clostridium peptidivorans]|uniref:adenylyl-sulfate kinase n=1 Tax=Clostridium peptidivorans TaxID=100174 RepID=UPI000BE27E3B|nr:adenylyl-sulfate kinase [Clostridium peptidivorans]
MEKGFTVWFTGLSSAGKSTLANLLYIYIKEKNYKVQLLDGDIMRESLGRMFGYKREDRIKVANIYRLMCKLLNDNGIIVITAAIAPFEEIREDNRKKLGKYIEIYVNCSIEKCIERDLKGIYKKAILGQEKNVIGIDEKFEQPKNAEIVVNTDTDLVEESFNKIKNYIHDYLEN